MIPDVLNSFMGFRIGSGDLLCGLDLVNVGLIQLFEDIYHLLGVVGLGQIYISDCLIGVIGIV